jgi:hypothetical protein
MADRPTLTLENDPKAVEEFVAGLQAAIDAWDTDAFNRQFAGDVLWGSPFGAIVSGYDEIHAIHSRMHAAASARRAQRQGGGSRYEVTRDSSPRARRSPTCDGSRSPNEVRSSQAGRTPSTSLPCSCSSTGTEPGGSLPDSTRPTGATSTGNPQVKLKF